MKPAINAINSNKLTTINSEREHTTPTVNYRCSIHDNIIIKTVQCKKIVIFVEIKITSVIITSTPFDSSSLNASCYFLIWPSMGYTERT